ncbi:MAG: hypothetical protein J5507_01270 [Clostridia bacterium]|nr:hypothetical protein [Clostridia bacterium]
MAKIILKETGIVLLLLVAIALVLGIIFYDYIPNNKTLPTKVEAYAFPEDVKEELSESIDNLEQNIVRTYYIDSDDLSLYESTNDYNKGKANPFAATGATTTNTANTTASNTVSNSNSTTNKVQDATNTSEYLNNKTGKY